MSSYGTIRDTVARVLGLSIILGLIFIGGAYYMQYIDLKYSFWLVFLSTLMITGIVIWTMDHYYQKVYENSTPEEDLATIKLSRSVFKEAVTCAQAIGADYPAVWSKEVLEEFQAIENDILAKPDKSAEARGALAQRACELATLRAFVAVPPGLEIQGNGAISEMVEWAVPRTTIERLKEHALNLRSNNLAVARMTLWALYKEEDAWSEYVDWYYHFMSRLGAGLLICALGVLVTALVAFSHKQVLPALIFGGMSGALLSVLMRLPSVVGHGDFWSYLYRILIRVGTGTAASVMGLGFFTSGLITLSVGGSPQSISKLIEACAGKDGCDISSSLFLLALAMVLGFTERALTIFEDKVFPPAPTVVSTPQSTPDAIIRVKVSGRVQGEHRTSISLGDQSGTALKAWAVYANKSDMDVTQIASWSAKDTGVVTVSNTGVCTPVKAGKSEVEATYCGRTGSMTVEVFDDGGASGSSEKGN